MERPKLLVFALCLWCTYHVRAQTDSVHVLRTVEITQSRLGDHILDAYKLPIDSALLALSANGTLTDLLRKQGLGHIRTYGPGGLATPSFRGTGGNHTAVLWNGINLVSPLSGELDFSLLPAGLFDDVSVQTGGSSSTSGNGSIGGSINLDNRMTFGDGANLGVASFLGSFGSQFYQVDARFSNQKFGASTKLFYASAKNDFSFKNNNVFPAERQRRQHNAQAQYGLMQQMYVRTTYAGIFSLRLWIQDSDYEVPNPTTVLRRPEAEEKNNFYRALAGWNFEKKNVDLNIQSALIRHDLRYTDPMRFLDAMNRYNSFIQNMEANISFAKKGQLTSGILYTHEEGAVDAFGTDKLKRNRMAFFSAYTFSGWEHWNFAVSAREELVNGEATPLAPTLSVKYHTGRWGLFTNVSRNYRLPTFNDLYWRGAGAVGNQELKSETSLNTEAGVSYRHPHLEGKAVIFTNHVNDWIQWTPQTGQSWSPQNIRAVWCRGLEAQATLLGELAGARSKIVLQYSFTKSTGEDIYASGNQNEIGKQLVLTPLHEGSATGEMNWKKNSFRVVCAYTGQQFTDSDNSRYNMVDDYLITNLWLSRSFSPGNFELSVSGEVNNVFNVRYVARPGYPLPGINFKLGIQIRFNKTCHDS